MEVIDEETGITDIEFDENNGLVMATQNEAIAQHCRQRIKTFLGEWFLDNQAGVPWLTQVLGRGYNPGLAEAVIKTVVIETAGVNEISSFSVSFDYRKREITNTSINVTTIYDEEVTV